MRFAIFRKNLERIDQVQKNEQGTAQYGVTKFADLTGRLLPISIDSLTRYTILKIAEEFAASYTNTHIKKPDLNPAPIFEYLPVPPSEKDWRSGGQVTAVPDQGLCGAGWAFATIGNIESRRMIEYSHLISYNLSAQQLLDCDRWSRRCHGGSPLVALDELIRMGGIMLSADYPYTGHPGQCRYVKEKSVIELRNAIMLPQDEGYQTAYLAKNGPLIMTLNAEGLQFYHTGVMNQGYSCDSDNLNHAGLTVGYGTEGDLDYWLVRNSWGKQWGEEGYFRIIRGEGICGIDRFVSTAIFK